MQTRDAELPIISIHAPPRGATKLELHFDKSEYISIHAPPRGATRRRRQWKPLRQFQFTPLREGRQDQPTSRLNRKYISIHAPPRGATRRSGPVQHVRPISIHAPPRGATICGAMLCMISLFQFTPLREGRLFTCCVNRARTYFNSRPSARGDPAGK